MANINPWMNPMRRTSTTKDAYAVIMPLVIAL